MGAALLEGRDASWGNDGVEVADLVDASLFLGEVPWPVGVEVARTLVQHERAKQFMAKT